MDKLICIASIAVALWGLYLGHYTTVILMFLLWPEEYTLRHVVTTWNRRDGEGE